MDFWIPKLNTGKMMMMMITIIINIIIIHKQSCEKLLR